jgi:hypothetical protein
MKFHIWLFFENLSRKFKFHINLTRITGTIYEDFLIIYLSVLLRMRNGSDKSCRENQNTHFAFNNSFSENRADYEIMWKCTVVPERPPRITIRRMRIACWIYKATYTISEYEILFVFPLQQWLHERASLLPYTYIACLVITFPCHTLKYLT